jgi:hypothetical protein
MGVVVAYLKEISGHSCGRLNISTKYLRVDGNPTGIRRECLRNRNMHMGICSCKATGKESGERHSWPESIRSFCCDQNK